jgi:ABC-type sulfate/molybdate transport systems ATPase subunit
VLDVDIRLRLGTFDLDVRFESDDETLVLFGHSGSGKSLTLASIAGLRRPDAGHISIGEHVVFDVGRGIDVPPQDRAVGYVVQNLALFPHLTVAENIGYGLGSLSRPERARRVAELIDLFGLGGLEERLPAHTSGGQQQRVALARALARPTSVLLLDEPFSALDESLRRDLRLELTRLRGEYGVPLVFVTHDLREAHLLGDRVAVLDRGRVLQCDERDAVFGRPASRRVAELTGVANIFAGHAAGTAVEVAGLPLQVSTPAPAGPVDVAIRAERCNLRRLDPASPLPENCYVATITHDLAFGNTHTLHLQPDGPGPAIEVEVASRPYEVLGVANRRQWVVELPARDLHVMAVEAHG